MFHTQRNVLSSRNHHADDGPKNYIFFLQEDKNSAHRRFCSPEAYASAARSVRVFFESQGSRVVNKQELERE